MGLKITEQTSQTLVLVQDYKLLRIIGCIFFFIGCALLPIAFKNLSQPLYFILPGFEMLTGFICFYVGAKYTFTINKTIRTFERHIKGLFRDKTEMWNFSEIKDILMDSTLSTNTNTHTTRYQYNVKLLLITDKKVRLFTHTAKKIVEDLHQLLKQYIQNRS